YLASGAQAARGGADRRSEGAGVDARRRAQRFQRGRDRYRPAVRRRHARGARSDGHAAGRLQPGGHFAEERPDRARHDRPARFPARSRFDRRQSDRRPGGGDARGDRGSARIRDRVRASRRRRCTGGDQPCDARRIGRAEQPFCPLGLGSGEVGLRGSADRDCVRAEVCASVTAARPAMSALESNGFSAASDASVLAERLQLDSGALKARARDPHAELKTKIHRACIARLGAAFLNFDGSEDLTARVRQLVTEQLAAEDTPFSPSERARLERQIADDILGYGPLEPFLHDPSVTEIMVNGYDQLYVERAGKIEETEAAFLDDAHLLRIIDRIVSQVGRRIDEASPMVDARLPDGSRVNAIIPPLALRGPSLTIRKFAGNALSLDDLIGLGTLTQDAADFLAQCVRGKLNILM